MERQKIDPRLVSKDNPVVFQGTSSGAELLARRLPQLVEQLNEFKLMLAERLAQYQPHHPIPVDEHAVEAPGNCYNNGIYFDNRFIELDEGFKILEECKYALNRAEI